MVGGAPRRQSDRIVSERMEKEMRFPTSIMSAQGGANGAADSLDAYRDAVQPCIDEPVIAACVFARQGMMKNKVAGHFGFLPYLLAKKHSEMRAGGLPERFYLAVTADHVYAIKHKIKSPRRPMGEPGEEVARWDRDGLRASYKSDPTMGGLTMSVTLESPSEGETVHCSVGSSPLSEDFLRLLNDPEATA